MLDSNLSMLNINAVVTSLAAGVLDSSSKNEALLVGTKTSILAYDVNENSDLFYKEVRVYSNIFDCNYTNIFVKKFKIADGANAIVIGKLGCNINEPVTIVGGNCSIMALNNIGDEVLWTVNILRKKIFMTFI